MNFDNLYIAIMLTAAYNVSHDELIKMWKFIAANDTTHPWRFAKAFHQVYSDKLIEAFVATGVIKPPEYVDITPKQPKCVRCKNMGGKHLLGFFHSNSFVCERCLTTEQK